MPVERRRLTPALLFSLLVHALLLSLTFGGQGLGLPGFGLPWQERRIEAPDLRIVLMPKALPEPVTAPQPAQASVEPPLPQASTAPLAAGGPALAPAVSAAPALAPTSGATMLEASPTAQSGPAPDAEIGAAPAPIPAPVVIATQRSDAAEWVVPAAPRVASPVIAATPGASTPQAVVPTAPEAADAAPERIDLQQQARAAELAEIERVTQENQRQAALREAARIEAERQDAVRLEAAKVASKAAAEDAAREAAKDAAKVVAREAAKVATNDAEARREALLRAIGRQLDEEAARRDAAAKAAGLAAGRAPSSSGARRGRLFGRTDPNVELILYAEAWARKIQLNMTFDSVRDAVKRPHTDPLVTVALRSDGSVESVTFVLSSGVADIDEGIRRIVQSQMPYPAFPPALAREFDVIEIRRTWHFDMAIRLY